MGHIAAELLDPQTFFNEYW